MSDLYDPRFGRGGYGHYNKHKNFVSMEAGTDAYFLEDEANELQWIQNELRAELVRKEYYSGIYQKEDDDIIIASAVLDDNNKIFNSFFVKPMVVNVNGYFINIYGNQGLVSSQNKLNYIKLPAPPEQGEYYDFVYLETCFVEKDHKDQIWFNGNEKNSYGLIENDLLDKRINGETNRRIQLIWTIRSARIPVDSVNLFDESLSANLVPAYGGYTRPSAYGFWNAPKKLDGRVDLDDLGLWIAWQGTPAENQLTLQTTDGYSYAIPLFKVRRRNTSDYTSTNLYGGSNVDPTVDSISYRPDGKFSNIIYEDDIIDIRNIIRCDNMSKLLHHNFENIMLNNVNYETKPYTTVFGVNSIAEDADRIIYNPCNIDQYDESHLANTSFKLVPGVEQEGITFSENNYLQYNATITNINERGITAQTFVKILSGSSADILSITDSNNSVDCYVRDGYLYVQVNGYSNYIKFKDYFDKFNHIALAIKNDSVELVLNNNRIMTLPVNNLLLDDSIVFTVGKTTNELMANDCTFDEIELSKVYQTQFGQIPEQVTNGYGDFSVDPQLNRKSYTRTADEDTYTIHMDVTSDVNGVCAFDCKLPITVEFIEKKPKIYFDNESIDVSTQANIKWTLENNVYHCEITNLGESITYNFVILAYVTYPAFQGLSVLPKKAYHVYAEKSKQPFYVVNEAFSTQEHNIGKVLKGQKFSITDKYIAYNPLLDKSGFCVALKYDMHIEGNELVMPYKLYANIKSIYTVSYKDENILQSIELTEDGIKATLTRNINDKVTVYAVTDLPGSVYSPTKCGIESLYKLEEIKTYGDGRRSDFIYRSDNKILSMLQGKFVDGQYSYAFVNGVATRVLVVIDGAFIHYAFEQPPENKADIVTYIVSEYDLLRSERMMFTYDTIIPKYDSKGLARLDGTDIVYHEHEIFVTTDGYGVYPYEKDTIDAGGTEMRIHKRSLPTIPYWEEEDESDYPEGMPDDDIRMLEGDTVIHSNQRYRDKDGNLVSTERNIGIDTDDDKEPDLFGKQNILQVRTPLPQQKIYEYLRINTDFKVDENGDPVVQSIDPNAEDQIVNPSGFALDDGVMYSLDTTDEKGSPIYKILANIVRSSSVEEDTYKMYIMDKNTCTLSLLPAIDKLDFVVTPKDILSSNKCDVIYDANSRAHVISRDNLPIVTNMNVMINYTVPKAGGSFLTTYNKIYTKQATAVEKGFSNCSIDNKSFYSLTTLDKQMKHLSVMPFIIHDDVLKMCIIATYSDDKNIYIDANNSAMDVYDLDNRYLIKHK